MGFPAVEVFEKKLLGRHNPSWLSIHSNASNVP